MKDRQIGPCAGHLLLPNKPPRHFVAYNTDLLLCAVVLWVTGLGGAVLVGFPQEVAVCLAGAGIT